MNAGIFRSPACRFNPRPRASGRPQPFRMRDYLWMVSIRARVRAGDPSMVCARPAKTMFQSAPACERATPRRGSQFSRQSVVSIRARVRAGDFALQMHAWTIRGCFNPRPRASGRRRCTTALQPFIAVSIRARVRAGDRRRSSRRTASRACFNPRPRASGRRRIGATRSAQFQSAPACERATRTAVTIGRCFNPRPRASGRHSQAVQAAASRCCFNPRPRASGRRQVAVRCVLTYAMFQSAPACERATCSSRERAAAECVFQSAPACERATWLQTWLQRASECFNPRPRASGRRMSMLRYDALHDMFQSAPACERATVTF